MKKNANIEAAAPVEPPPVEPPALLPLAELVSEGFGWDNLYARTPEDAIDALAAELVGRGSRSCSTTSVAGACPATPHAACWPSGPRRAEFQPTLWRPLRT